MPSTDTRAALVERLYEIASRLGTENGWADAASDIGEAAILLARSAPEERGEGEQRCIAHAAYMAEGDCVICDKELAEERATVAETRVVRLEEEARRYRRALTESEDKAADAAFNALQAADHPTAKMDKWVRARLRQGVAGNATAAANIARRALTEGGEHADD